VRRAPSLCAIIAARLALHARNSLSKKAGRERRVSPLWTERAKEEREGPRRAKNASQWQYEAKRRLCDRPLMVLVLVLVLELEERREQRRAEWK
jgi:hypothetical protein